MTDLLASPPRAESASSAAARKDSGAVLVSAVEGVGLAELAARIAALIDDDPERFVRHSIYLPRLCKECRLQELTYQIH